MKTKVILTVMLFSSCCAFAQEAEMKDKRIYIWVSGGINYLPKYIFGDQLDLNLRNKNSIYSASYFERADGNDLFSISAKFNYYSVSIGRVLVKKNFIYTASVGPSFANIHIYTVNGSTGSFISFPTYKIDQYYAPGLVFKAQVLLASDIFGAGLSIETNLNVKYPSIAFGINIALGKIRDFVSRP
jgi:hypothetical protein